MQRTTFDTQLLEEPPDPPATAVNGRGRQFRFMLHVIGERFDLLRPGSQRSGSLLQTPHELEPSDGKSDRGAVAWLAILRLTSARVRAFRGRLANPSICAIASRSRALFRKPFRV